MVAARTTVPAWFRLLVVLLLVWELVGCFACVQQFRMGAAAMGPASDYDRALYAALPGWYDPVYAVATFGGAAGMVALLLRSALAIPLTLISLAAVVVQFGYLLAATDIIAVKGIWVAYFPLFIAALSSFMVWLAFYARRRGWIG